MNNFKLDKGLPYLMVKYWHGDKETGKNDVHSFSCKDALMRFIQTPQLFENAKLPSKMPDPDLRPIYKKMAKEGEKDNKPDCTNYLDLHLGEMFCNIFE